MRAQKPVQFNAGSFFVVSLETFSQVTYTPFYFQYSTRILLLVLNIVRFKLTSCFRLDIRID